MEQNRNRRYTNDDRRSQDRNRQNEGWQGAENDRWKEDDQWNQSSYNSGQQRNFYNNQRRWQEDENDMNYSRGGQERGGYGNSPGYGSSGGYSGSGNDYNRNYEQGQRRNSEYDRNYDQERGDRGMDYNSRNMSSSNRGGYESFDQRSRNDWNNRNHFFFSIQEFRMLWRRRGNFYQRR